MPTGLELTATAGVDDPAAVSPDEPVHERRVDMCTMVGGRGGADQRHCVVADAATNPRLRLRSKVAIPEQVDVSEGWPTETPVDKVTLT